MARGSNKRIEPRVGSAGGRAPGVTAEKRSKPRTAPGRGGSKGGGSSKPARSKASSGSGPPRKGGEKRGFLGFSRWKRGQSRSGAAVPQPLWRRVVRFGVYWSVVLGLWATIAVAGIFVYYGSRLPQVSDWAVPDRDPVVTLVSHDGRTFAQRGTKTGAAGSAVPLDEISPWMPAAVIAIEDRRFRSHFGLDPIGLVRAMGSNLAAGRFVQGGSTITQQLAKNVFLSSDRSIERKVQELLIAFWLERRFSKDRILELYLNRVYFGHGTTGVEAASRRYFGKSARELTLMEAAILAGSLKAPSRLNPESHPRDSAQRASVVLSSMVDQGVITPQQREQALTTPPDEAPGQRRGASQWASDAVMRELRARVPNITADLTVETTIDMKMQEAAQTVLRDAVAANAKRGADQGAVVLMDGVGSVRAIVGGIDYSKSQFNRASRAKRQPGSAFKVFTFLAALEKGLDPASIAYDEPFTVDGWSPKNYDGTYRGPVTLEEAFAASLNTVAAQIVAHVGSGSIKAVAERLGVRTELTDNLSLSLGTSEVTPLELTLAYVPFANGGFAPEAHLIERVTDGAGKVVYERALVQDPQVIRAEQLAQMQSMLRAVVLSGTGVKARVSGHEIGGKTGTSQQYRDAWFVGVAPGWVATVWIGADSGKPMKGVTGGSSPAEAFSRLMALVLDGKAPEPRSGDRWITLPTFGPTPLSRSGTGAAALTPFAATGG